MSSLTFKGGFHLHLLVFPFDYRFHSRIEALVCSSFANDKFRWISTSFQHHFKICLLWLLHEKECSFYSYLFCCTEMRWLFISSSAIWVTGSDTSSVALEIEVLGISWLLVFEATERVSEQVTQIVLELINNRLISVQQKR